METTLTAPETLIEKELKKFNVTDAAIADLQERFMPLAINGIDDKEGAKKVREARITVKNERVKVEKMGKELRADAIKFQKAVISEEKRIVSLLEPIETHLENEEARIAQEKENIRLEAERLQKERVQKRVNQLFQFGVQFNGDTYSLASFSVSSSQVCELAEEEWETTLSSLQTEYHAEQARLAEIERLRLEEEARLEQVRLQQGAESRRLEALRREQEEKEARFRAEQEAVAREMAQKQAYMLAEQQKIENERLQMEEAKRKAKRNSLFAIGLVHNGESFCYGSLEVDVEELESLSPPKFEEKVQQLAEEVKNIKAEEERIRQAEIKAAEKAAADKAKKDAEAKAKRQAEEKAEIDRLAKLEEERIASLMPDKDKLLALSEELSSYPLPTLSTPESIQIIGEVKTLLGKVCKHINEKAEALTATA